MNRRNFLYATGTSLLTLTSLERLAAAPAAKKAVGLQLYTLRNEIGKMGIEMVLAEVAKLGYQKMESFGYGNGKFFGKTPAEYAAILKANGLTAPSGHYMLGSLKGDFQRVLDDAKAIGQEYVVVAYLMPDERSPEAVKGMLDLMNSRGEQARKAGLTLGYHNHDFEFTQKVNGEKIYDLLLKNTDVPMEVDLYWIVKAGEKAPDYFAKYPGRFPLWHVKDVAKTEKGEFAEVGTGSVDFASLFKQAKQAGLKHYFVEQDVSKDPMASIKTSIDNIQNAKWG
jgi:sugar phosphate isomerase/epimerase